MIAVILVGSLFLMLPFSTCGASLPYLDALFTATSATCVTGLAVVDTGAYFSCFGQVIIMLLIFTGSLGFMTMATLIFVFLGRRITLWDRILVQITLHGDSLTGAVPLVRSVIRLAVLLILTGTLLMSYRFIPEHGWGRGIFFALFHAVSAFGNAGFDLFGGFQSLVGNPGDYLVNGTILVLLILGGLGHAVIFNVAKNLHRPKHFTLHSRMVLIISGLLLVAGAGAVFLLERGNPDTLCPLSGTGKIFGSLFTAATRTTGFSVVDTGLLRQPTVLIMMMLMFIGASPASTGGGIKTTTAGIVSIALVSLVRGRPEPVIFYRRIPIRQVVQAMAITGWALVMVLATTFLLNLFEKLPFQVLLFEAVSAFSTVGLSYGITPDLSGLSKIVIIAAMFIGRVSPLTLLLALARPYRDESLRYPEEKILIG